MFFRKFRNKLKNLHCVLFYYLDDSSCLWTLSYSVPVFSINFLVISDEQLVRKGEVLQVRRLTFESCLCHKLTVRIWSRPQISSYEKVLSLKEFSACQVSSACREQMAGQAARG